MTDVTLRHFGRQDADWLVEAHGRLYLAEEGYDDSFRQLVVRIVEDFLADHDPAFERGWVAERGGEPLGTIFCVREGERTAKLRLFLVVLEARGLGLGKALLAECLGFARAKGYETMRLWTHESHRAACALYAANGFRLVSSEPAHSFGVDVIDQIWELTL